MSPLESQLVLAAATVVATGIIAVATWKNMRATEEIADLTEATEKLYQLEMERHRSSRGRAAARLLREEREIVRNLSRLAPENPRDDKEWAWAANISERRAAWIDERRDRLSEFREEFMLGPEAMAFVDTAHDEVYWVRAYWQELLEAIEKKDTHLYEFDRELSQAVLREIARSLERAYQSVNREVAELGGDQESFDVTYEPVQ